MLPDYDDTPVIARRKIFRPFPQGLGSALSTPSFFDRRPNSVRGKSPANDDYQTSDSPDRLIVDTSFLSSTDGLGLSDAVGNSLRFDNDVDELRFRPSRCTSRLLISGDIEEDDSCSSKVTSEISGELLEEVEIETRVEFSVSPPDDPTSLSIWMQSWAWRILRNVKSEPLSSTTAVGIGDAFLNAPTASANHVASASALLSILFERFGFSYRSASLIFSCLEREREMVQDKLEDDEDGYRHFASRAEEYFGYLEALVPVPCSENKIKLSSMYHLLDDHRLLSQWHWYRLVLDILFKKNRQCFKWGSTFWYGLLQRTYLFDPRESSHRRIFWQLALTTWGWETPELFRWSNRCYLKCSTSKCQDPKQQAEYIWYNVYAMRYHVSMNLESQSKRLSCDVQDRNINVDSSCELVEENWIKHGLELFFKKHLSRDLTPEDTLVSLLTEFVESPDISPTNQDKPHSRRTSQTAEPASDTPMRSQHSITPIDADMVPHTSSTVDASNDDVVIVSTVSPAVVSPAVVSPAARSPLHSSIPAPVAVSESPRRSPQLAVCENPAGAETKASTAEVPATSATSSNVPTVAVQQMFGELLKSLFTMMAPAVRNPTSSVPPLSPNPVPMFPRFAQQVRLNQTSANENVSGMYPNPPRQCFSNYPFQQTQQLPPMTSTANFLQPNATRVPELNDNGARIVTGLPYTQDRSRNQLSRFRMATPSPPGFSESTTSSGQRPSVWNPPVEKDDVIGGYPGDSARRVTRGMGQAQYSHRSMSRPSLGMNEEDRIDQFVDPKALEQEIQEFTIRRKRELRLSKSEREAKRQCCGPVSSLPVVPVSTVKRDSRDAKVYTRTRTYEALTRKMIQMRSGSDNNSRSLSNMGSEAGEKNEPGLSSISSRSGSDDDSLTLVEYRPRSVKKMEPTEEMLREQRAIRAAKARERRAALRGGVPPKVRSRLSHYTPEEREEHDRMMRQKYYQRRKQRKEKDRQELAKFIQDVAKDHAELNAELLRCAKIKQGDFSSLGRGPASQKVVAIFNRLADPVVHTGSGKEPERRRQVRRSGIDPIAVSVRKRSRRSKFWRDLMPTISSNQMKNLESSVDNDNNNPINNNDNNNNNEYENHDDDSDAPLCIEDAPRRIIKRTNQLTASTPPSKIDKIVDGENITSVPAVSPIPPFHSSSILQRTSFGGTISSFGNNTPSVVADGLQARIWGAADAATLPSAPGHMSIDEEDGSVSSLSEKNPDSGHEDNERLLTTATIDVAEVPANYPTDSQSGEAGVNEVPERMMTQQMSFSSAWGYMNPLVLDSRSDELVFEQPSVTPTEWDQPVSSSQVNEETSIAPDDNKSEITISDNNSNSDNNSPQQPQPDITQTATQISSSVPSETQTESAPSESIERESTDGFGWPFVTAAPPPTPIEIASDKDKVTPEVFNWTDESPGTPEQTTPNPQTDQRDAMVTDDYPWSYDESSIPETSAPSPAVGTTEAEENAADELAWTQEVCEYAEASIPNAVTSEIERDMSGGLDQMDTPSAPLTIIDSESDTDSVGDEDKPRVVHVPNRSAIMNRNKSSRHFENHITFSSSASMDDSRPHNNHELDPFSSENDPFSFLPSGETRRSISDSF